MKTIHNLKSLLNCHIIIIFWNLYNNDVFDILEQTRRHLIDSTILIIICSLFILISSLIIFFDYFFFIFICFQYSRYNWNRLGLKVQKRIQDNVLEPDLRSVIPLQKRNYYTDTSKGRF